MTEAKLLIDQASVFDDLDQRRVDFDAEADGERLSFTLQYDALEALAGDVPDDRAVALFHQHRDRIAAMAARALARGPETERVVVSENDLDQPG
jgi:hypothetical protein